MSESHAVRILCVEDEPITAKLLQERLVRAGYEVDLAYDGEEGLAKWLTGFYDVLTTDHDMPKKKGLELLHELTALGPLPLTVMITGHGNETIALEAMKLGADDYIIKDSEGRYLDLVPQNIEHAFARRRIQEERIKAEEGLRESEEKYRNLFNNAGVGMFRSRLDGSETLEVNDKFLKILNRTREGVLGKPSVILWADPLEREEMVRRLNTDGQVTDFDFTMLTAQGEERTCLTSVRLYPEQGILEGSITDITGRKEAEEDLKAQKNLLEAIFETSPYIIMVVHEDGRVESINRAGAVFSGGPKEDLPGRLGGEIFHCTNSFDGQGCGRNPECPRCPVRTKVMHTFQTGEAIHESEGRLTVRTDAGDSTLDLLVSTALLKVEHRNMVLVTIADITDRKKIEGDLRVHRIELETQNAELRQAQIKLEELKDRYLDLYDFGPVGYVTLDVKGLIVEANLAAVRLLGEERQRLTTMFFSRFVCQEFGDAFYSYLQQVFETQLQQTCEIRLTKSDGTHLHAQLESIAVQDESGEFSRCRTIVAEITERKKMEEEIRASVARLKEAQRVARIGSWELGLGTNELSWSDEVYRMFEIEPRDFGGSYEAFLDLIHPEDRETVKRAYTESLANKTPYEIVYRLQFPDGRSKYLHERCEHSFDAAGVALRSVGTVQDITELKQVQLRLEVESTGLRTLVQTIPDLVWLKDPDGIYLTCNPRFERFFGAQEVDIVGKTDYDFVDADLADFFREHDQKAMAAGKPSINEEWVTFADDGHSELLETIKTPMHDSEGSLIGVLGIARNITDRKISEKMVRIRLELLEFARSHSLDELLQNTLDEVCSLTNSPIGFCHLISEDEKTISLQAWSTRTIKEFCEAEGKGMHYSLDQAGVWADAVRERRPVIHNDYATLPHRKGMPEGHAAVIRELVVPIVRSNGIVSILGVGNKATNYTEKDVEVISYLGDLAREIIDRTRTEEALKEKDKQYRDLFEGSMDGVYSVVRDGTITDANPSVCDLLGYSREELIGTDIRKLYLDPAERPRFQKEIEKKGFVKDYELKLRKRDGTAVDCIITTSVHFGSDGSIIGYRGIIRDLTARKALHMQLLQAQKMESIGTLAGGIAHDFNNLLLVIMGNTELAMENDSEPEAISDYLQETWKAATRAKRLVEQILAFSRHAEQEKTAVSLPSLVKETVKFLRSSLPATIEVRQRIQRGLPQVWADPTRLHQVLMNLCANAAQAMRPKGGILEIRLSKEEIAAGSPILEGDMPTGPYIRLTVKDTGAGADPGDLPRIFEPYFTTKGLGEGTGLGLAVVHGIAKAHQGLVTVESEPGKGSQFHVLLPAIAEEIDEEKTEAPSRRERSPLRLLLVDDEVSVAKVYKGMAETLGHSVVLTNSGREALDLFSESPDAFDLLITDMTMPRITGAELSERVLVLRPDMPIILCTGFSEQIDRAEAERRGIRGFLFKPFTADELSQLIDEICEE